MFSLSMGWFLYFDSVFLACTNTGLWNMTHACSVIIECLMKLLREICVMWFPCSCVHEQRMLRRGLACVLVVMVTLVETDEDNRSENVWYWSASPRVNHRKRITERNTVYSCDWMTALYYVCWAHSKIIPGYESAVLFEVEYYMIWRWSDFRLKTLSSNKRKIRLFLRKWCHLCHIW